MARKSPAFEEALARLTTLRAELRERLKVADPSVQAQLELATDASRQWLELSDLMLERGLNGSAKQQPRYLDLSIRCSSEAQQWVAQARQLHKQLKYDRLKRIEERLDLTDKTALEFSAEVDVREERRRESAARLQQARVEAEEKAARAAARAKAKERADGKPSRIRRR